MPSKSGVGDESYRRVLEDKASGKVAERGDFGRTGANGVVTIASS